MTCILAPAKINAHLEIFGKRADGLHNLRTIFLKINLFDALFFRVTKAEGYKLEGFSIPLEQDLLYKAFLLFKQRSGLSFGLETRLEKQIPQQAGLGGGSSDAGLLLKALNRYFGFPIEPEELASAAASLGADVPFFVSDDACALAEGIGDRLAPLPRRMLELVVAQPAERISTVQAFAAFDEAWPNLRSSPSSLGFSELQRAWQRNNPNQWPFFNSFEKIFTVNHANSFVSRGLSLLRQSGAIFASLSGSGSALFGVYAHAEQADKAQAFLSPYYERTFRCQTL